MSTAFSDVKPWPKGENENPRVKIGGNNPPLEERTVLDFDEALRSRDGLIARIDEIEAKAGAYTGCATEDEAGRATDFIKAAKAAADAVEEEREKLNRPILNAQRALMARSRGYAERATSAGAKVRVHLDKYLADEKDKQDKETARLAEIQREADLARQAEIDAANLAAQVIADAETKRLQDIEDARAAKEKREAVVVEVAPEPVYIAPAPTPVFSAPASRGPVRGLYGSTASLVETWDVKVESVRQVPDAYLKHPSVIEAIEKVIRPSVRGKNGVRIIKGCRIFSTTSSAVR